MQDDSAPRISYRVEGRIAYIGFNRPGKLNAGDLRMEQELEQALGDFDADPDAWVAVVYGEGRCFGAGVDVKSRIMDAADDTAEQHRKQQGYAQGRRSEGFLGRAANWKPVISAVHGYCLGLHLQIALESDLIVATPDATFGITEIARGLSGGRIWARIAAFHPSKLATELLLTGRQATAEEFHRMGLVNRLAEPGRHVETATALAEDLVKLPPLAVRAGVRASRWRWLQPVAEADLYAQALHLERSADAEEATRAHLEGRAPEFRAE